MKLLTQLTLPSEQRAFSEMIWRKLASVKDLPGRMFGSYMDGAFRCVCQTGQGFTEKSSRSESGCEVAECKAILFAFFLTIKQGSLKLNIGSTLCIKWLNMSLSLSLKEKRCLKVFKVCPILC